MGSVYGYITVANLEAYTGIDYETTDGTYDDTFVEATITIAERFVNTKLPGTTPTATDGVITATLLLSARLMLNVMIGDGHRPAEEAPISNFVDDLISKCLGEDKYSPVDSIAQQGVNPY